MTRQAFGLVDNLGSLCYTSLIMNKHAQDRSGTVHLLDPNTPNKADPWQRALCGDPGDFMVFNEKCPYCDHEIKLPPVTCKECLKALKKEKRVIDIHIELKKCDKKCLYFEHKSGMGHCEDWDHCNKKNRPIEYSYSDKRNFPEWCPLEEK